MRKVTQLGVLVIVLVLATGLIGASSFTTATLTRDTSINVVSDTNGLIGLGDELPGPIIEQRSSGELTIDFSSAGSADGVNVDSVYELGDPNDPVNTAGFNITNNDGVSHTINISYTITSPPGDGAGHNATEFQVYDSGGTQLAVISEDDSGAEFTLSSAGVAYVVVVIDTTDAAIDNSDDLSGTLTIRAT